MGHTMGESICLSGPRASNDEQWLGVLNIVLNSTALFRIERCEIRAVIDSGRITNGTSKHSFRRARK
jgi:hypothetical protein